MFALTPDDLSGSILDCAAGPASFNAEFSAEGRKIISCDPLYRFTADEIRSRIDAAYDTMVSNIRAASDEFVWRLFASPENLGEARMAAMEMFLDDFPHGMKEGRYLVRSLPHLGFRGGEFDLALSFHVLFTHSERLFFDLHVAAVEEMCTVDVHGCGRGACLPAIEKLRRTFSAPRAGGGYFAGSRLPG